MTVNEPREFARVQETFLAVRHLDPPTRDRALRSLCARDVDLCTQVEELLRIDDQPTPRKPRRARFVDIMPDESAYVPGAQASQDT